MGCEEWFGGTCRMDENHSVSSYADILRTVRHQVRTVSIEVQSLTLMFRSGWTVLRKRRCGHILH